MVSRIRADISRARKVSITQQAFYIALIALRKDAAPVRAFQKSSRSRVLESGLYLPLITFVLFYYIMLGPVFKPVACRMAFERER